MFSFSVLFEHIAQHVRPGAGAIGAPGRRVGLGPGQQFTQVLGRHVGVDGHQQRTAGEQRDRVEVLHRRVVQLLVQHLGLPGGRRWC